MMNRFRSWINRLYQGMETRDHELRYLFLEITRRCNLNCRHCGSDCSASADVPELSTESWIRIVDYVHDSFGTGVDFIITGGEPLVHPGLEKIGNHITGRNMRWGMVTNGMALTYERLCRLSDAGLYSITVSYDGGADSHNYLRASSAAHAKAAAALRLIAQSSVPMKDAVTCVYPKNIDELDGIARFMLECGMPAWRLFRIFPSGRAASDPGLFLDHRQTWRMLEWIAANKKRYAVEGLSINASCEGWVPFALDRKIRDMPFFCRAGINIAGILCDGTITGCTNNSRAFHQGSVLNDSLSFVWENRFREYRERSWLRNTSCADCSHFRKCRGGSIHLWKNMESGPEFCYMKKSGQQAAGNAEKNMPQGDYSEATGSK